MGIVASMAQYCVRGEYVRNTGRKETMACASISTEVERFWFAVLRSFKFLTVESEGQLRGKMRLTLFTQKVKVMSVARD